MKTYFFAVMVSLTFTFSAHAELIMIDDTIVHDTINELYWLRDLSLFNNTPYNDLNDAIESFYYLDLDLNWNFGKNKTNAKLVGRL